MNNGRLARLIAATAFACASALTSANAAIISFESELTPEVALATGSGSGLVEFDDTDNTLRISSSWSGLSGTTTVAHIHCCVAPPGTVGVAVTPGTLPGFPVGVTAGDYVSPIIDLDDPASFTGPFVTNFGGGTIAGAIAALLAGMGNGTAYFNIHTTNFPGGEIRGFLQKAPEPATLTLILLAGAGLLALRRRDK